MNILFVAINAKYPHTNLAVRLLRSEVKKTGVSAVFIEHTINTPKTTVLDDLLSQKADAVMFSCYIWNINYIHQLADKLKKQNPTAVVIFGGPEVSFDAPDMLKKYSYIDYIITGEGEKAIKDFARLLLNEQSVEICSSLVYRENGQIIQNSEAIDDSFDIADFPYPDLDDLNGRVIYYEASRGCPYQCAFCLSACMSNYREKPMGIVKRDLMQFITHHMTIVKLVDRTFNANKKRAMDLIRFIISESKNTCFHLELSPDLLDDDFIDLLNSVPKGLIQLEFGVQSTHEKTLDVIHRNGDFHAFAPKIKRVIQPGNIHVHVDLIAGLPFENIDAFSKSFDDAFSLFADNLQLGFLKLLKGSELRQKADEYGLIYDPVAPYEIIRTPDMSESDFTLLHKIEYLLKRFYNSGLYKHTIRYLADQKRSAFTLFHSLSLYIEKASIKINTASEMDLLDILWRFAEIENLTPAKDIMLFEAMKKRKRPSLPKHIFGQERFDFKNQYKAIGKSRAVFPVKLNYDVLSYIKEGELRQTPIIIIFDYSNFNQGVSILTEQDYLKNK